jgi:endonuclease III
MNKRQAPRAIRALRHANPAPTTELEYRTPFELLVAVVLSAQATDKGVNRATAKLFPVANTPAAILALGEDGLKRYISSIGLYNAKARNIVALCGILLEAHGGKVPRERAALEALPGVGRKTANVVLNTAFGEPTDRGRHAHLPRRQPHRSRARQDRARRRGPPRARHPGRVHEGRAPLADPAWPLCLQGAQTRLPACIIADLVRLPLQDAGRGTCASIGRTRCGAPRAPCCCRVTGRACAPSIWTRGASGASGCRPSRWKSRSPTSSSSTRSTRPCSSDRRWRSPGLVARTTARPTPSCTWACTSLREQVATDRPAGIAALHQSLRRRLGRHEAEHRMAECLAEALWRAQRNNALPDEVFYMEALRSIGR